jgi:hypothetical protein
MYSIEYAVKIACSLPPHSLLVISLPHKSQSKDRQVPLPYLGDREESVTCLASNYFFLISSEIKAIIFSLCQATFGEGKLQGRNGNLMRQSLMMTTVFSTFTRPYCYSVVLYSLLLFKNELF